MAVCTMIVSSSDPVSVSSRCHPACPVRRSIIWSWLHRFPCTAWLFLYTTTTLPSGVGSTGVSQTAAGSGTLHTSAPSDRR